MQDRSALERGFQESLDLRFVDREWALEEELALRTQLGDALRQLRAAREDASARLRRIREVKDRVLAEQHVRRAISYWDRATRPGTSAADAFQELYRMQEMLERLHGNSERGLAEGLGIPMARLKSLKRLANAPEHDFRHATIGDPTRPPADEVLAALEDARAIVQAFIERRYRQLEAASEAGAAGEPV